MNRDGTLHSLWQDTTPDFNARSSNNSNKKQFDVIIAGAGMTGITTGLMLQKQGKSVLIAEAQTLGFGTTGGTTAHLNTFLDTSYDTIQKKFGENDARMVAQATKDAIDLIKKNIEEYKIECEFRELPGFLFSQDEKQTKDLEQIYNASRESGVEVEWSTSIPVPIPFEKALCFPGQALFHPMRYLVALAQAFEEAGGIILQNCRVTSLDEGETHTIHTTNGDFTASHFIYATHIPPGVNLLHFRCAPRPLNFPFLKDNK